MIEGTRRADELDSLTQEQHQAHVAQRRQLLAAAGWSEAPQVSGEALASLLRQAPGEPGFCELVLLLAELDRAAGQFWLLQGHAEA